MLQWFKFEKRAKYPHMMPGDVEIWERFIENNPDAYEDVAYDVSVGAGPDFDTSLGDSPDATALNLYLKKIDVVGKKGTRIDIIELKPNAGASALGQVLGYVVLYKRDVSALPEPRPVLITDRARIDLPHLAESMGVTLILA